MQVQASTLAVDRSVGSGPGRTRGLWRLGRGANSFIVTDVVDKYSSDRLLGFGAIKNLVRERRRHDHRMNGF